MDRGNEWTRPVGPEVTARARTGDWSVVLIGYEPVPHDWFPADIKGTAVLCLASGGGQQGPVLAAASADATARYMPGYFATRAVKPTAPYSP